MGVNYTYQHQYYLDISDGDDPKFANVIEDTAFGFSNDDTTYDRNYKSRKTSPSYVTGRKTTCDFDIDIVDDAELQKWMIDHEDDRDVPTKIVRHWTFSDGTEQAKMAEFTMTENPIDGEAGELLRATGTMTMTSDGWTYGSFDPETGAFVPDEDETEVANG